MTAHPFRSTTRPLLVLLAFLITGCASQTTTPEVATTSPAAATPAPPSKGQQELAAGIASYENGQYKNAAKQLQTALDAGLESKEELAQAHKYLAFIHCVSRRTTQCREEFRKAIDADPDFTLTPAEAGHPTWGPVFRKLKAAKVAPAKKATKPAPSPK